jgi:putative chitinase
MRKMKEPMNLASEVLAALAPDARANYVGAFQNGETALATHQITTPLRLSHFLAQILQETGGGKTLVENLTYTTQARLLQIFGVGNHSAAIRPDEVSSLLNNPERLAERVYGLGNPSKARELGNIRPGDGYKYRGRGALQTTGSLNYQRAGNRAGVDFYASPDLMVAASHILAPALNDWTDHGLNAPADRNDIRTITKAINGGYNGIAERQEWFDKIWPLANGGAPDEPWQVATANAETAWLQRSLNDLGLRPVLVVDGLYGPATKAGVKWFQAQVGLTVDGEAGEITRAAIRLRLAAARRG